MGEIYTSEVEGLGDIISRLEGQAFGEWLRFACLGYDDELSIDIGSWTKIPYFERQPELRDMADELNTAMKPVLDKYKAIFRQKLANKCINLANVALEGK